MKTTDLNSRQERNAGHAKEFKNWVKNKNVEVLNSLPGLDLEVGQKVTFVNGYGVKFEGHTILGFHTPDKYGDCIYLDIDCYWFSVSADRIIIEKVAESTPTPSIGQYVFDIYYNCKKQVKGIANGLFYIGSDHEPVHRNEFIFPLPTNK